MKIGLFGGTFDPPHLAHLIVAEITREQFRLDQIWWIPARRSPQKVEIALTPAKHRLAMTRCATKEHASFLVSDREVQRPGPSRTIDTVRAVCAERPEDTFSLLVGGDHLEQFETWHEPQEIVALVPLIVYPRPGRSGKIPASFLEGRVRFVEAPLLDVTGSEIRRRVRQGKSIRYLVSEATRTYIRDAGLYTGSSLGEPTD